MRDRLSFLMLFLLSLLLIVLGFQGGVGKFLACIFAPAQVVENLQL